MQARKRAKPVKFGKQAEPKLEKAKSAEPEEVKEKSEEKTKSSEEKVLTDKPVLSEKLEDTAEVDEKDEEKAEEDEDSLSATPPVSDEPEKSKEFETFGIAASPDADSKSKVSDSPLSATIPDTSSVLSSQPASSESGEALPLSSAFSTTPDVPSEKKKGNFLYFVIVAVVSFIVGLGAMAGFEYATQNKMLNVKLPQLPALSQFGMGAKATPTPKPAAPTEVPEEVDLTAYTIRVLNGSGIQGEASRLKEKLATAGFEVGSVGNADRDDYTKTQVAVKKSVNKAFIEKLKEVLGASYELDKESVLPDSASDESDITVTIGSSTAN